MGGVALVSIGASTIVIVGRGAIAQHALAALRVVDAAPSEQLHRARYPRTFMHELQRVRDAYQRLGTIRAVRNKLHISQQAVRFRLALADEIGSRRLGRPDHSYQYALRDLPQRSPVAAPANCAVEMY